MFGVHYPLRNIRICQTVLRRRLHSAVAAPEKIQLNFSENLTVKFSGAKLTMTGMKGMSSHSPMPVAAKVAPGADPKSMVIIPREPLPAGTYRVDWRAVSSDTHPITGNYTFTVK
ncbi:copper homeostasis periplasmic binding protein CopC [Klebsiella pneumoniae]|uniref:copper homeostasis periplasmic binding protein CopC n=1 Tax=Klebsiella pneumoniae TaxID=573 RepID=UPI001FAF1EE8|nr:copper homeostasis periplasmic binding protein CopC [Klebsiella pneumoniae]